MAQLERDRSADRLKLKRSRYSRERSSSFLKKRTKKLLLCFAQPHRSPENMDNKQKFFGSFFQKRTASSAVDINVVPGQTFPEKKQKEVVLF